MHNPNEGYSSSCYYNPEKWGLELIDCIDYSDGSYCFDYRAVWLDLETGKLLSAADSGCSCPTPFENFKQESDFELVTEDWVKNVLEPELESDDAKRHNSFEDRSNFLHKIKQALKK